MVNTEASSQSLAFQENHRRGQDGEGIKNFSPSGDIMGFLDETHVTQEEAPNRVDDRFSANFILLQNYLEKIEFGYNQYCKYDLNSGIGIKGDQDNHEKAGKQMIQVLLFSEGIYK
jgi:hypothetical protein